MTSELTLPSLAGYFAGLLYNPNNVSPESSPVTLQMELEVGADILKMLGFTPPPRDGQATAEEFGWAHVTSGGTVANIEALWIARNVAYFPLAVRDACVRHSIAFPDARLANDDCAGLPPRDAIELHSRFIDAVHRHWDLARSEAIRVAHEILCESRFSVAHSGVAAAYAVRAPVLLVSGARHYSIAKAADVLGIGRGNVVLIDTDRQFRMDLRDLDLKLRYVEHAGHLPVAVIGVAGTTEEGAVDPIHRIAALRREREARGRSFWLHVDAAWGGYLRSLFCPPEEPQAVTWADAEVPAAFRAIPRADSVTVDPHKLGYIPYPCGVAAYRNDLVRQFVTDEIPYISTAHYEDTDARRHRPPNSVGPYILEGSKPGAAVASCWLSHRVIPPDRSGYGQIMRVTLLAARDLYNRLAGWRGEGYRLLPVTEQEPDTNVVCFVVCPYPSRGLTAMNTLNRELHRRFSSPDAEFFLSRTVFEPASYSSYAVGPLLERAGVDAADYRREGLFVLRAVVMNPHHGESSIFPEMMAALDRETRCALDRSRVRELTPA